MAFAPSRRRRRRGDHAAPLQLNAMMDMMTIILLFLLKTWGATGALMQPSTPLLARSSAEQPPRKSLSLLLTPGGLYEDVPGLLELPPEQRRSHLIAETSALDDPQQVTLLRLEDWLGRQRRLELDLGKSELSRTVTLQAERDVPYAWVLKLINASTRSGYDLFEFIVLRDEAADDA